MNAHGDLPRRIRRSQVFGILACLAVCALCLRASALVIIPTFDSTITSDPNAANIEATLNYCIAEYEAAIQDTVTVPITFSNMTSGLGESFTFRVGPSYANYRSALVSHATTSEDSTAIASLSNTTTNPVNGNTSMSLGLPISRALGLASFVGDGRIALNIASCNVNPETDNNGSDYALFAVACHEIDEVLGGGGGGSSLFVSTNFDPNGAVGVLDVFRYSSSGVRSYTTNSSATSYFSIDGGVTSLAPFNQNDQGDFADFASSTPLIQNAFGTPGAQPVLSVEWKMLDVIGYNWNGHTNIWCNPTTASGAGTVYSPVPLATALSQVGSGGGIIMKTGTYHHTGLITTVCSLHSANGTATIQP
jgi:hypothetical protein